jgi:hypothetical protein
MNCLLPSDMQCLLPFGAMKIRRLNSTCKECCTLQMHRMNLRYDGIRGRIPLCGATGNNSRNRNNNEGNNNSSNLRSNTGYTTGCNTQTRNNRANTRMNSTGNPSFLPSRNSCSNPNTNCILNQGLGHNTTGRNSYTRSTDGRTAKYGRRTSRRNNYW